MKWMSQIFLAVSSSAAVLLTAQSFALTNRIDVLGYGGYSQVSQFSDSATDSLYDTPTGFDGGASLLLSLSTRLIAPVIGAGGNYMQLTSKRNDTTQTYTYTNTLSSLSAVGHAGVRVSAPLFRLFLLGNVGQGVSGNIKTDVVPVGGSAPLFTFTQGMSNHIFYGGSGVLLVSAAPFLKVGVMGVCNMHSANLQNSSVSPASYSTAVPPNVSTTYQETSGNLVIDFSL